MTNEPPTGDGEELVEADLPGLDETPAEPPPPPEPATSPPAPELSALEHVDRAIENTEASLRAQEQARQEAFQRDQDDFFQRLRSRFDDDPPDSVIDDLGTYDLPRAMVPDMVGDSYRDPVEEAADRSLRELMLEIDSEERQQLLDDVIETLTAGMPQPPDELTGVPAVVEPAVIDQVRSMFENAAGPRFDESAFDQWSRYVRDPFRLDTESEGAPPTVIEHLEDVEPGIGGDSRLAPGWMSPGKYRPPLDDQSYLDRVIAAPSWIKALILGFIAAGGIFVVSLTGGFFGSSDSDNAAVSLPGGAIEVATIEATPAPTSVATTAPTAAPTVAPTTAPVVSGPPEGYTTCQIHPDEDEFYCKPYYAPATSKNTLWPVRRYFERTVTFRAPIPTSPERPLEYKLVISGSAGPTIEQILSGGAGETLICTRLVNGAITADGPNDVCALITAPDTIYMQADLSAYGEGPLKIEWFATELEEGDVLRGDYSDIQPDATLPAP